MRYNVDFEPQGLNLDKVLVRINMFAVVALASMWSAICICEANESSPSIIAMISSPIRRVSTLSFGMCLGKAACIGLQVGCTRLGPVRSHQCKLVRPTTLNSFLLKVDEADAPRAIGYYLQLMLIVTPED